MKYKSCYDLHNSVFLAPDEIRTCCKRYHFDGKFKGDVPLFKVPDNIKTNELVQKILDSKEKIVQMLNTPDGYDPCNGCPFIEEKNWDYAPLTVGIKYLSLEYHSICNMRCDYCSDLFYGGITQNYDVTNLLKYFNEYGYFDSIDYVVWGGGEPTLGKDFDNSLKEMVKSVNMPKIRMITNSTTYNETIKTLIDANKLFIVTSIDAGSEDTFKEVRGLQAFEKVLKNLKRYSNSNPKNVIIKYIIKENNYSYEEINSFVSAIKRYGLENCYFQISVDFREDVLNIRELASIILLFNKLSNDCTGYIFFDDLILQRLPNCADDMILDEVDSQLISFGLTPENYCSVRSDSLSHLAIIGTGSQARIIAKKIKYFAMALKLVFVDPTNSLKMSELDGIKVISFDLYKRLPDKTCVIGAVQSSLIIYDLLESNGLLDNLISKPCL